MYHLAVQSGLRTNIPGIEQADSTNGAMTVDRESSFQDQAMPSNYGSTPEFGTDSLILAPSESLVSYRSESVREPPSREYNYNNSEYISASQGQGLGQSDIQVYFSPKGGCTAAIVSELNRAHRQILIQAYSFTSEPIAAACVAAHQRGVQVCAVLDKSQETEQYSAADFLANSGIPTLIDTQHAIAHNKVILIDGSTLITGSFNFTSNAEQSNAENLLIVRNRLDLYSAYEKNLQHHFEHSKKYVGRGTTGNSAVNNNHRKK